MTTSHYSMEAPIACAQVGGMGFENMKVYQAAVLLDAEVRRLLKGINMGPYSKDVDQLLRAIASILYNIAEAWGSLTPGRKIYHIQVARGSTDEARAAVRRIAARGAIPASSISKSCVLTSSIAKMLTSWISALEEERGT